MKTILTLDELNQLNDLRKDLMKISDHARRVITSCVIRKRERAVEMADDSQLSEALRVEALEIYEGDIQELSEVEVSINDAILNIEDLLP